MIAETGAGQHGVATATGAALVGLACEIYMGTEDMHRQSLNVFRMRLLGARVIEVPIGSRTLKDAINEALRDWTTNVQSTHYVLGTVFGPHPFPVMVRDFQSVIGREARKQILDDEGRLPDYLIACVGGGSNAMGLFYEFLRDDVKMIGVEAGGKGIATGEHAARFAGGSVGVFQGCKSYLLQDDDGNVLGTHSVSAGLDYASIGPEHPFLRDCGRVQYSYAVDEEALAAFELLSNLKALYPHLNRHMQLPRQSSLRRISQRRIIMCQSLRTRGQGCPAGCTDKGDNVMKNENLRKIRQTEKRRPERHLFPISWPVIPHWKKQKRLSFCLRSAGPT